MAKISSITTFQIGACIAILLFNSHFSAADNNNNINVKNNFKRVSYTSVESPALVVASPSLIQNDDVLLTAGVASTSDEHATDVNRHSKRSSFLPNHSSSSNRNYFRDLISRNNGNNFDSENTLEYSPPPPDSAFTSNFFMRNRKHQSEGAGASPRQTREVHIKQGRLIGVVREMHVQSRLRNVDQFLGIPYAEAPIGTRRFMPPSSPLPWHGIKYANKLEAVCPQKLPNLEDPDGFNKGRYDQIKRLLPYLQNESEDCLYLNLYVTSLDENSSSKKYPVIVFLHGESFEWNSGNPYDGSILASYGQVIVITLNYRLGALGFMKPGLNDQTVANFGLLDIIAALQWIKENIQAFGGNPSLVNLLGHDTGAICGNFLMVSPISRGLFHRAILMSGSALSDWALNNNPQQVTMQVAKRLNCPIEDSKLGECLRQKSYKEISNITVLAPEFVTIFGPIVDGLVIPSDPRQVMAHSDAFSRFDLLFGMSEIESYNILGRFAIQNGIEQIERDHNIRKYLTNRFDKRPEVAFLSTLKEYGNLNMKQKAPTSALDNRDMLLEILSDARVAAPMIQTGIYLSRNNPKCYMYVWAHNSESGEHAQISQSIHGEDLPFIFGAPLGPAGPFQTYYSAEERLLSESVIRYFTNFAKTGNPTVPWPNHFNNLSPIDWQKYDIDWQEFNEINQNYLHLGIPPIVSQRYRHKYAKFWNDGLMDAMKNANSLDQYGVYGKFLNTPSTPRRMSQPMPTGQVISMYPIKVEIEGPTVDPVRELHHRLQQSAQTSHTGKAVMSTATESINYEQISTDEQNEIFKSEATMYLLISVIVAFLLVNVLGALIYFYRRNKKINRKYDNSNIFDAVSDDKRSKFNDTDDSFILDVLRKSSNTYESVKRHSPINGFGMMRQTSTSTVDTHTKVSDWISNEISKYSPRNVLKQNSFAKKEKVSIGIDATPQARSNSILRQEPIEITKAKTSSDYGTRVGGGKIICQEIDMDISMIDEISFRGFPNEKHESDSSSCSSFSHCDECAIQHQHSYSDPVKMLYHQIGFPQQQQQQEEITSFIEEPQQDVNVTSRDELSASNPLSPEESLRAIQKMNYPKVLPNYPENLQFNDSTKRRSLQIPPQYYQIHNGNIFDRDMSRPRPNPPPRMSSTLGRRPSRHDDKADIFMTPPVKAKEPPAADLLPEITSNTLIVGPIVPKFESIYMTMQRKQSISRQNSRASHDGNQENPSPENTKINEIHNETKPEHLYAEIIKNSRVQTPQDGIYSISASSSTNKHLERQCSNSQESNSSTSSSESSTGTIKKIN